jgi:hypothetical protein
LSGIIFRCFSGLIFLPPVSINGEGRQQETDDAESQGQSKDSLLPRISLRLHFDLTLFYFNNLCRESDHKGGDLSLSPQSYAVNNPLTTCKRIFGYLGALNWKPNPK